MALGPQVYSFLNYIPAPQWTGSVDGPIRETIDRAERIGQGETEYNPCMAQEELEYLKDYLQRHKRIGHRPLEDKWFNERCTGKKMFLLFEDKSTTASGALLQLLQDFKGHPHWDRSIPTILGRCLGVIFRMVNHPDEQFLGRSHRAWLEAGRRFKAVLKNSERKRAKPRAIVLSNPIATVLSCVVENKSKILLRLDHRALAKMSPLERALDIPSSSGYWCMDGTKFNETQSPHDLAPIFRWALGDCLGAYLEWIFLNKIVKWTDWRLQWNERVSHYGMMMGMFNNGATLKTLAGMGPNGPPVFIYSDDAVSTAECTEALHRVAFNISTKKSYVSPYREINSAKLIDSLLGPRLAPGTGQSGGGLTIQPGPVGSMISAARAVWSMRQWGQRTPSWAEVYMGLDWRFNNDLYMPGGCPPFGHEGHAPSLMGGVLRPTLEQVIEGRYTDCLACQRCIDLLIEGDETTEKPIVGARRVMEPAFEKRAKERYMWSIRKRRRPTADEAVKLAVQKNIMVWPAAGPASQLIAQLGPRGVKVTIKE